MTQLCLLEMTSMKATNYFIQLSHSQSLRQKWKKDRYTK